jgi:hypothetical protein
MRPALVTLAVASSLLGAAPLVAQMTPVVPSPSVFTVTPHIGMTTYSDIAKLPIHDDGSDPSFPFSGHVSAKFDAQLTFGVSGEYGPLTSRWGGFLDFSRSGGGAEFAVNICDPDFGCDGQSIDAEGSQWRASAGVTRRFPVAAASMATLSLGALYAKTHFEAKDPSQGVADLDESSPGAVVGLALDFPFSPRVGVRLQARDALMRVKGSTFARDLNDIVAGSGIVVESDDKFSNAFTFGAGLVLRW